MALHSKCTAVRGGKHDSPRDHRKPKTSTAHPFTLNLAERSQWYPPDSRLGRAQAIWKWWKRGKSLPLPGIELSSSSHSAHRLVIINDLKSLSYFSISFCQNPLIALPNVPLSSFLNIRASDISQTTAANLPNQ